MVVDKTEWEDFERILRECGMQKDEFETEVVEEVPPAGGIYAVRGSVTVTHKKSGWSKTYRCGHASTWLVDFERDLGNAGL